MSGYFQAVYTLYEAFINTQTPKESYVISLEPVPYETALLNIPCVQDFEILNMVIALSGLPSFRDSSAPYSDCVTLDPASVSAATPGLDIIRVSLML